MRIYAAACLIASLGLGCQASVKGKVKSSGEASAEGKAEADPFADLDDAEFNNAPVAPQSTPSSAPSAPPQTGAPALLGARHDLYLKGKGKTQCECISVSVGEPQDKDFAWEVTAPRLDSSEQVVVAFNNTEGDCSDAPEGAEGASYRGYVQEGPNIIILLEPATQGKPTVTGAIVPTPGEGGKLYTQPYLKTLPYGKGEDGTARCTIGSAAAPSTLQTQQAEQPKKSITVVNVRRKEQDQPSFEDIEVPDEFKEDDSTSKRDSFYLSLMLGGGYSMLTLNQTNGDATINGLAFGFDVYAGGALSPGWVLGLTLGGAGAPEPDFNSSPAGQAGTQLATTNGPLLGVSSNLVSAGVFTDWYPMTDSNLHLLFQLGYLGSSFSGTAVDVSASGLGLGAGLGYDFWLGKSWSLGLLARGTYGFLSADTADSASLLLPMLLVTLTYH